MRGRRLSQLAERLSRSTPVVRLPARRGYPPAADSAAPQTRPPRPHSGSLALAGPNTPARPGEVEGGAALSAWVPPLRPREFPAPARGAAPRSGGGGNSLGQSWVRGAGPGCREGAWPRRGAPYRGGGRGELTDRSANERGKNATAARKSPRSLREWHVPNASCCPSPTVGASWGLPARFPASSGARPRLGARTWAGAGFAPTHAHKAPPPPAGVCVCVSVCVNGRAACVCVCVCVIMVGTACLWQ